MTRVPSMMCLLIIGSLLVLTGCGSTETSKDTLSRPLPVIEASDQESPDPIDEVVIDRIVSDGPGWAVVRMGACMDAETGERSFGPIIGYAKVSDSTYDKAVEDANPAENLDTNVSLEMDVQPDASFCAILHEDNPADGNFDYQDPDDGFSFGGETGTDKPVLRNNAMVMVPFSVEAPAMDQ